MAQVDEMLAREFACPRCQHKGAKVERLSLLFEIQPYRYAFVSCTNCGYTEIFNLRILEGRDDLGTFLEVLFAD
jgi:predicted nucleic-acid-binding Zn-ribbon protein